MVVPGTVIPYDFRWLATFYRVSRVIINAGGAIRASAGPE